MSHSVCRAAFPTRYCCLRDEADRIHNLPPRQQQEHREPSENRITLQLGAHPPGKRAVKAHVRDHGARVAITTTIRVEKRTAAVPVVQAGECPERLGVTVFHLRGANPSQRSPLQPPSVAELPVLRRRRGELPIESTARQIVATTHGNIVAGKEIRDGRIRIKVLIDDLQDQLARFRAHISGESVDRRSASHRLRERLERGHQRRQPTGRWQAVVICECQDRSTCLGNTTLAGCRWPRVLLPQDAEIESISPSSWVKLKAVVAAVVDADEPAEAERLLKDIVAGYQKTAPQPAAWLEQAAPEAFTVLMIPTEHRRRLRATNGLERLNKEIMRCTRVATLFPNKASLLRLASAVLSEISDDWETERAYLSKEAR
jgi:hypothetical protein